MAPPSMPEPVTAADRLRRRVVDWLDAYGTQAELAKALGIKNPALHARLFGRKGRKGRTAPTQWPVEDLEATAAFFEVSSPLVLLADEDDALWPLRPDERRLVTYYRDLPRLTREQLLAFWEYALPVGARETRTRDLVVRLRRLTPAARAAVIVALDAILADQPQTLVPMLAESPASPARSDGTAAPARRSRRRRPPRPKAG